MTTTKHISMTAPPPQTQATTTNPAPPLVLEHINIDNGEIGDCLAWPRVLASTCCPDTTPQASKYFSYILLSLFLYLILHLWLSCALRVRAKLSLSLSLSFSLNWNEIRSLFLYFSMSNCLYFITLFDILTLSVCEFVVLCIMNFVCCECFISLMFCVMLIDSCDSCLLSGGGWGSYGRGVGYLNWGSKQVEAVNANWPIHYKKQKIKQC